MLWIYSDTIALDSKWWFHWLKNRVKKDICNNIVSYISQLRHPTKQMRCQWYTSEITSDFPRFQTCTWFSALQTHREWKHTSHDSWFIRMTKSLCYSPNRAQYRRLLQQSSTRHARQHKCSACLLCLAQSARSRSGLCEGSRRVTEAEDSSVENRREPSL